MIDFLKRNLLSISILMLSFVAMTIFLTVIFPSNYEKCIKFGSLLARSKESVFSVYSSCQIEFKSEYDAMNSPKKLTSEQVLKLDGSMGPELIPRDTSSFAVFSGKVYNGNSDIKISRIVISVGYGMVKKQYSIETNIDPLSYGSLSVTTLKLSEDGYSKWEITDAYGYPYK